MATLVARETKNKNARGKVTLLENCVLSRSEMETTKKLSYQSVCH